MNINNKNKIQCLECNNFYNSITFSHLKKCSGITIEKYRLKYQGVNFVSIGLCKKISKGMKGKKFTEDHCKNISKNHKGMTGKNHSEKSCKKIGDRNKGKKRTDEQKINYRIGAIKRIENRDGIIFPNFSFESCEFFSWLNKALNWNGQYALNIGEFYIKELGYFVDYYEPELDLIIEYDEKHHIYQKEKDQIRECEIMKKLNPKLFLRFEEEHMKYEPSILSQFACGII